MEQHIVLCDDRQPGFSFSLVFLYLLFFPVERGTHRQRDRERKISQRCACVSAREISVLCAVVYV